MAIFNSYVKLPEAKPLGQSRFFTKLEAFWMAINNINNTNSIEQTKTLTMVIKNGDVLYWFMLIRLSETMVKELS